MGDRKPTCWLQDAQPRSPDCRVGHSHRLCPAGWGTASYEVPATRAAPGRGFQHLLFLSVISSLTISKMELNLPFPSQNTSTISIHLVRICTNNSAEQKALQDSPSENSSKEKPALFYFKTKLKSLTPAQTGQREAATPLSALGTLASLTGALGAASSLPERPPQIT